MCITERYTNQRILNLLSTRQIAINLQKYKIKKLKTHLKQGINSLK